MVDCAKCGKHIGFFSTPFNSHIVYDLEFNYRQTLNERCPYNPYRKEILCGNCYQEVYENPPTAPQTPPEPVHFKEIIKETQVIVKIRCPYCSHLYDENANNCPHCGGKR